MKIRNLRAIGPDASPVIDPIFSDQVAEAELVIDAARASLRGRVVMTGPVDVNGTIEDHGEFLHGTAYVVYTIRDESTGHIFKEVGFLQVPALGPTARGYWICEASVCPGAQALATRDVQFGPPEQLCD